MYCTLCNLFKKNLIDKRQKQRTTKTSNVTTDKATLNTYTCRLICSLNFMESDISTSITNTGLPLFHEHEISTCPENVITSIV